MPPMGRAMAAEELGQRMHDDVRAVVDRPHQDRRGYGVVDDQRHAVPMRHFGQRLDVADVAGRIADALAEHRAGVLVDQGLDIGRPVAGGERPWIPAREGRGEEAYGWCRRAAAWRRCSADVGQREHGVVSAACPEATQRSHPALQLGDPILEHGVGRIGDAGVAVAVLLEVESAAPWSALSKE